MTMKLEILYERIIFPSLIFENGSNPFEVPFFIESGILIFGALANIKDISIR